MSPRFLLTVTAGIVGMLAQAGLAEAKFKRIPPSVCFPDPAGGDAYASSGQILTKRWYTHTALTCPIIDDDGYQKHLATRVSVRGLDGSTSQDMVVLACASNPFGLGAGCGRPDSSVALGRENRSYYNPLLPGLDYWQWSGAYEMGYLLVQLPAEDAGWRSALYSIYVEYAD